MKQTIYTLIAYIPGEEGWHDRCGDYHSGKDSSMKIQYFTDIQSAGEFMGQSKFDDNDTDFTVLINGLNEDESHEFLSNEEQKELEDVSEQIRDISYKKYEELQKTKLQKEEEIKIKKAQEEFLKQQKAQEQIEQIERAQLAQLQAKYKTKG